MPTLMFCFPSVSWLGSGFLKAQEQYKSIKTFDIINRTERTIHVFFAMSLDEKLHKFSILNIFLEYKDHFILI